MSRVLSFTKREWKTVVKFVLVGGSSFLVYLGAYTLLSRGLFPQADEERRVLMNLAASGVSILYNYLAHRFWTYQAKEASIRQLAWYVFVAVSVTGLQTALFWFGHVFLGLFDYLVIVLVGIICACYTFLMHRFFTFRITPGA